jgi:hypothetical protein
MTEEEVMTWTEALASECLPVSFVTGWADEQIIQLELPPIWLLDLCVASTVAEASGHLRRGRWELNRASDQSSELYGLSERIRLGCHFIRYERDDIGIEEFLEFVHESNERIHESADHLGPEIVALDSFVRDFPIYAVDADMVDKVQLNERLNKTLLPFAQLAIEQLGKVSTCHKMSPHEIDPGWLKWNDAFIPKFAQSIYEERRFEDMPILGDALEDAGCDHDDVLNHCRHPVTHVRGCWLLDLVLRKQRLLVLPSPPLIP